MDTKSVHNRDRTLETAQRVYWLATAVADDSFRRPAVASRASASATKRAPGSTGVGAATGDRIHPKARAHLPPAARLLVQEAVAQTKAVVRK
jgi:hypothetical protein